MFGNDNFVPLVLINLLGIAGIVVWHIQGGNRPTGRLIVQILFFTNMSLVLYLGGIAPHRPDGIYTQGPAALLSKSARILWWTHLAWTIIGFIQIYVRLNRKPREAHLIQDMAIAVIYLGVALSVIGFVFGMPVGTLVATSGVIAVIFGLALQNTLGDVFSGIALTLGRAYAIGDWVQLNDGTEGRVIETTWRSTNLLTVTNNVVVLPNSILAKQGVTNLSRPDETHLIALRVRIAATQRPRVVEEVMRSVLRASVRIVKDPPPVVALKAIDAIAIEVELQFRVDSVAIRTPAKNEIVDLLHDQCRASGLSLAMPAESLAFVPAPIGNQYLAESRPVSVTVP
ncbi:mechanosensitive ion channel family protein [Rhizobium sp. SEMIA 4085]|uniref:Small-conductance mechanosensitive channel n=1 Tax=Rhizobium gallicum bv. gallicum R602sp TaxID=1041138 RepID=A0A0B4X7H4_9HYPH|nr:MULTISPECIES: mechanosensitive ion channel family protein [Rhizobium]AJD42538.1 mechanosensitive ion channel MscS-like protein [Rhizobium gallicum bv. gallicum R602sp]NNH31684.1 mechanosensitive ion channel family protein [Rhizobium sp. SEMIA 4085]